MDENIKCPICHQPAKIGYACGDYFMHCSDGCPSPMCDHPTESVTLASWLDWVKWYNCNQPDNNPITLEELRGMDGEPVWIKIIGKPELDCWGYHDEDGVNGYTCFPHDEDYGKTWLAYRSRPGRDK